MWRKRTLERARHSHHSESSGSSTVSKPCVAKCPYSKRRYGFQGAVERHAILRLLVG
jgi:hypothetical protein